MRRTITFLLLAGAALASLAQGPRAKMEPAEEQIATAFTVGTLYTFAVMRNGTGYCLPPEDRGVDVIWKKVKDQPDLFKNVKFEPNRLPEAVFLKLLQEWFPCR